MATRRKFVIALGAGALAPPALFAQQPTAKIPRIGVLFLVSLSSAAGVAGIELLRLRLRELGYVEGRTVAIEYRSAEGRGERLAELAANLVKLKVDLIITGGGNVSTLAARKATSTIPIVMSGSYDAVESGLVDSLGRPGGNVTGLTVPREMGSKQVELLRELVPSLSRIAILLRRNSVGAARLADSKAKAEAFLQLALDYVEVEEPEELTAAIAKMRASRPGAMIVGPDPLFFQKADQIIDFARTARIPTMYPVEDFVEAGGLVSYSVSLTESSRVIARHIDKILKGAKPGDIPVEQPMAFEFVLNLKTAKALGIKVPQTILLQATRVIE